MKVFPCYACELGRAGFAAWLRAFRAKMSEMAALGRMRACICIQGDYTLTLHGV